MTFLLILDQNIKNLKPGQKLICDIIALIAVAGEERGETQ